MTEQPVPEQPLALLLRVQEWAVWMAIEADPQMNQLKAISGETGIELQEGEQLVDIDVVSTNETRTVPVPAMEDEPARNVRVKLVVFRATLARRVKGVLPDNDLHPTGESTVWLPTNSDNRSQRRKRKR